MTNPKSPPQPAVSVEQAPEVITYNPVYQVTYEGADPTRGYVYRLSAAPPADGVPAGFVLVPVDLTQDMANAGDAMMPALHEDTTSYARASWSAMLKAAPKAPTAPIGEAGEGIRDRLAKAMYDAWPHKVISKALAEVTGMPVGATLTWDVAKASGADFTGLYRYVDAALAALSPSAGAGVREALELLGETLFNLSALLKTSGFFEDPLHHATYETVVAAFRQADVAALGDGEKAS